MQQNILTRLFKSEQGNFSVFFALVVMVIILCIGVAHDAQNLYRVKSKLNDAADSAALAAISFSYNNSNKTKAAAKKQAEDIFTANADMRKDVNITKFKITIKPKVSEADVPGALEAQVNYEAKMDTTFMGLFGKSNLDIKGNAVAAGGLREKTRLTILVDNSSSMGIGATRKDQTITQRATGCALACHFTRDPAAPMTTLEIARAAGATARIDVVRDAVVNMLKTLQKINADSNSLEIEIYTFSNQLTKVYGPGNNVRRAQRAAKKIDVTRLEYSGGTNLHYALDQLATLSQNSGDASERRYTIILTDGLEDSISEYDHDVFGIFEREDPNFVINKDVFTARAMVNIQPLDPVYCERLHKLGHQIYVLNTEYIIPKPSVSVFPIIETMKPSFEASLKQCAGDDSRFLSASSPTDIKKMAKLILDKVIFDMQPRITH